MNDDYFLSIGKHPDPEDGRCAMEWVSFLTGQEHSDRPRCVDPVLRELAMQLNDGLADDPRQSLRPYLARMIGTADDGLNATRKELYWTWKVKVRHAHRVRCDRGSDVPLRQTVNRMITMTNNMGIVRPVSLLQSSALRHQSAVIAYCHEINLELLPSALELLEAMLPNEVIKLPPHGVEYWGTEATRLTTP